MDTKGQLDTIRKIRSYRVNKKKKRVAQIERAKNALSHEIQELAVEVTEKKQVFQEKKIAILDTLKKNRSSVDEFFSLQKKERLHHKYLSDSRTKKYSLEDDVHKKGIEHADGLKDLWLSEKALMKIDEFIDMEPEG